MLKPAAPARRKIPVYDTQTIGGHNDIVANTNEGGQITEEIDAGDWFPEATAAIYIDFDFDRRKADEANRRIIDYVLYGKK